MDGYASSGSGSGGERRPRSKLGSGGGRIISFFHSSSNGSGGELHRSSKKPSGSIRQPPASESSPRKENVEVVSTSEAQTKAYPVPSSPVSNREQHKEGTALLRHRSDGELGHWRMTNNILAANSSRHVGHISRDDVSSYYALGSLLGEGVSGVIRRCTEREGGLEFACKTVSKSKLRCSLDVEDLQCEVSALQRLNGHPGVVGVKEVFEDPYHVHIVLEFCSGGDLFDRLRLRKRYPEPAAAQLCGLLVAMVKHCHSLGIAHRDLKPENILMMSAESDVDVRVADFGRAAFFHPGELMTGMVGSAYYVAPEVLHERYGPEADIWSLGIILYILLSGAPPFRGEDKGATFKEILSAPLDVENGPWRAVSEGAKDVVRRMLIRDVKYRITAAEILAHKWILEHCPTPFPSRPNLIHPATAHLPHSTHHLSRATSAPSTTLDDFSSCPPIARVIVPSPSRPAPTANPPPSFSTPCSPHLVSPTSPPRIPPRKPSTPRQDSPYSPPKPS